MNIVGIDLGTNKAAYTHITGDISSPIYKSFLVEANQKETVEERMVSILSTLLEVINTIKPELLVVEYPFNIMGNAKILVELFGVIHFEALLKNIPFLPLPQTKIKKYTTGHGTAEKSDIRMQAYKEFGLDLSEDLADSFFITHFGMSYLYGTDKKFRQESVDGLKDAILKSKNKKVKRKK